MSGEEQGEGGVKRRSEGQRATSCQVRSQLEGGACWFDGKKRDEGEEPSGTWPLLEERRAFKGRRLLLSDSGKDKRLGRNNMMRDGRLGSQETLREKDEEGEKEEGWRSCFRSTHFLAERQNLNQRIQV